MPLVIPAARDLSGEAWNSFVLRLEQRRAIEEERKRREEAADPGGGGLGAGVGAAAGVGLGLLLAPVTMGASLGLAGGIGAAGAGTAVSAGALATGAAVGGLVGGGVGRIAGSLVDPPGSGFPGGQGAEIGAGLQQIAGGVVQGAAARADLLEAEEAKTLKRDEGEKRFLQRTAAALGFEAIKGFDDFKQTQIDAASTAGRRKPTGPEIEGNFLEHLAGRAIGLRRERLKGELVAGQQAKKEAGLVKLYEDNIGSMAKMGEAFELNKFQIPDIENFQKERVAIPARVRNNDITPEEGAAQLRTLGAQERAFAVRLQPKPRPMISMEQLNASGGKMEEGRIYSIGDPKTATEGRLYTGRSVNTVPIRRTGGVVQSESDKGLFERIDDDGKRIFSHRRLSDGRDMGVGKLHLNPEFPDLGPMYFDPDGVPKPFVSKGGKGGGDDPIQEAIRDAATTLGKDRTPEEALSGATAIVSGSIDAATELQEKIQRTAQLRKLKAIHGPKQFIDAISKMDPNLQRSLNVVREVLKLKSRGLPIDDPLLLQEVRDAQQAIGNAFGAIEREMAVTPRVRRMMRQMERVAAGILGTPVPTREVPPLVIEQQP